MIISEFIPKRKKRKANAKQRMLKASWEEILKKYDVKPQVRKPTKLDSNHSNVTVYRRECGTNNIPSLDTGKAVAPKKEIQQYTGDAMIGIGQLHKSNAVPIFSKEDAIDISKMRRG
jgi:hypothetical protein